MMWVLHLSQGFYAITGPNGSGKTTLAKLIMGINELTNGKIVFNGTDIAVFPSMNDPTPALSMDFNIRHGSGTTFRDLLSISLGSDDEEKLVKIISRVRGHFPGF